MFCYSVFYHIITDSSKTGCLAIYKILFFQTKQVSLFLELFVINQTLTIIL
jgi:hypothetical protein